VWFGTVKVEFEITEFVAKGVTVPLYIFYFFLVAHFEDGILRIFLLIELGMVLPLEQCSPSPS
jgi:hypothetical protein